MEEENTITYKQMVDLGKKQWEVAMQGCPKMLIWLGKNYLGQTDSTMVIAEEDKDRGDEYLDLINDDEVN